MLAINRHQHRRRSHNVRLFCNAFDGMPPMLQLLRAVGQKPGSFHRIEHGGFSPSFGRTTIVGLSGAGKPDERVPLAEALTE